mmetsp:Transcript_16885/g.43041  ORF Transcript_16885/g.43041 Transcript_16885/m.43041 type:complete len:128 (-) Transcript_16885:179-562(-)
MSSGGKGTVKRWNDEKGFGFISPDDGGDDVFVHRTGLQGCDALNEGDYVTYALNWDDRKGKYRAEDVVGGTGQSSGGKGGGKGFGKDAGKGWGGDYGSGGGGFGGDSWYGGDGGFGKGGGKPRYNPY